MANTVVKEFELADLNADVLMVEGMHESSTKPAIIAEIRQLIFEAKKYIGAAANKQHATWEVYKAVLFNGSRARGGTWLQRNVYNDQLTLGGHVFRDMPSLLNELEDTLGTTGYIGRDLVSSKLRSELARGLGCNPVAAYLGRVAREHPDGWDGFDGLSKALFGLEGDLYKQMLGRWLVGAVARTMEPGCFHRGCLVLKGRQEAGKTAFLKALATVDTAVYYTSLKAHENPTDIYRKLKTAWIAELEELCSVTRKKEVGELKALLSATEDEWTPKYVEAAVKEPRKGVMAATVNDEEFLRDATGESRFWVMDMASDWDIPVDYLKEHKDLLWAEAYKRYREGYYPAKTDRDFSAAVEQHNLAFKVVGDYAERIDDVLAELTAPKGRATEPTQVAFRTTDILSALGEKSDPGKSRAIAAALVAKGYEMVNTTLKGSPRGRYYMPQGCDKAQITLAKHDGRAWKYL